MKFAAFLFAAVTLATCRAAEDGVNPIQKVLELLSGLQAKVVADGEASQKIYEEYAGQCKDRSVELHQSIKTATGLSEELKAAIEQAGDGIDVATTKIEDLSSAISTDESDLNAATKVRTQEAADFAAAEKALASMVDTLHRAIGIVEKEMAQGGASFVQSSVASFTQALSAMVDASSLSTADASQLTALLQNSDSSESDNDLDDTGSMLGAPSAAAYESHSAGLVDTLEGLLDKAESQLSDLRKEEATSQQSYEMMKQSLDDRIANSNKELDDAKSDKSESAESKATNEKALEKTEASLASDTQMLSELHHNCMTRATEFEEETSSRADELKALAEAKKIISESTGGAESLSYGGAASFVQVSQAKARYPAVLTAVHAVKKLARKRNSAVLSQLASKMEHALRGSRLSSQGVFDKVKSMIEAMVEKLEGEADAEAEQKAFCDKEMSETSAKQEDKTADVEKMTAKIDKMTSQNTQLKKEIATVQKELYQLAKTTGEMDKVRKEEHDLFVQTQADLEQGVKGVQTALKVLRDYYSLPEKDHQAGDGAGSSIIGILEVCESDFSKGLSVAVADEDTAQSTYEDQTKENQITKASKEQDATYKTKESKSLEKSVTEYTSDRSTTQDELDAVNEYMDKLKDQCVAKAEPYEERKKRREQEMAGLREAMDVLSAETAEAEGASLIQAGSTRHFLSGVRRHSVA